MRLQALHTLRRGSVVQQREEASFEMLRDENIDDF
jgi:hypothetical protein